MKKVTVEELRKLQAEKDNLAVINVLSEEQFQKAHIPGSLNVPRASGSDFPARVERVVGGKDTPVVVYCSSTECETSPKAGRELEDAGFSDVRHFAGGMRAWQDAGRRVESGRSLPA